MIVCSVKSVFISGKKLTIGVVFILYLQSRA